MIQFHNTLSKTKEAFIPLKNGHIGMYNCGPTVYGRQHIGNLRSAVLWDLLRRALEFNGYNVHQVVNITDFGHLTGENDGNPDEGEDKMAKGLRQEGLPFTLEAMRQLANKYTEIYQEDRAKLNLLTPTHLPFASDHIVEQIELIQKLEKKEFTYTTSDGVYFDTSKDTNYGKLSPFLTEEASEGGASRIGHNPEKKNPRDFALWKFAAPLHLTETNTGTGGQVASDATPGWNSPWGKGYPGWHIECSTMSMKYLGESFDIHTGGIEHIPIHHQNEIAQSESATDQEMARFWLHNEHLLFNNEKLAKSAGNVIYLDDIIEKGYDPLALRMLFLQAHYRSQQSFSWEALDAAQTALSRLRESFAKLHVGLFGKVFTKADSEYFVNFTEAIDDDLDIPKALALTWELIKDNTINDKIKRKTLLAFDEVLGIKLGAMSHAPRSRKAPAEVQEILNQRQKARDAKDWDEADRLRDLIQEKGVKVKDTEKGQIISFQ